MLKGLIMALSLGVLTMVGTLAATAAEMKPIHTQKTKDITVTLQNESGQWKEGKNEFVLAFTAVQNTQPVDVGKVSLNTSMAMPGMAPMVAGAMLTSEGPGRYRGTINFADRGARQVTVTWDGPAGKGSTKFSVPVR
ncbi:MAG TPA: FixH family protein [Methylomirabilota bacterium]|nr:FixH family protein [Methylomirabilota bacterium]